MYVQCLVENEISSETEALVGKTGSSVDQHLAAAIGLDYRIGHPDLFHVIDGLGRPFFGHRASQPKKTESSESSASSSSSSSVCSDGGQRAGQAEQADCSGQSSAREPAPPVPVLRTWSRLVRTQKRMLGRGQGRVVFNQARPELSVCTKNRLKALLHLLVLFLVRFNYVDGSIFAFAARPFAGTAMGVDAASRLLLGLGTSCIVAATSHKQWHISRWLELEFRICQGWHFH